MTIALAIAGILCGGLFEELPAVLGLAIGLLAGWTVDLKRRVRRLEREIQSPSPSTPAAEKAPAESAPAQPSPPPGPAPERKEPAPAKASVETPPPPAPDREKSERGQPFVSRIHQFLTGGNPILRIGLVVLFFGVGFLVKYAADHAMFPVELRLAAAGAAGIALLGLGWRLRHRRPNFARLIQGGAVGILYLTLFAAARLYGFIPPPLAFGLMVALVALSGALAVLQDAAGLAAFGAAGGFLAPVLTSSGGGGHVTLFSYYALLNAGIFGVAWYRAWRPLNLLGAIFTFGIGTAWGAKYYRPDHFATAEPFLVLFTLMYILVAILFASRQPPKLKGYVDGSLVFGVPLAAFGLQAAMVSRFEYGLAISALTLGGVYIGLASTLWRRLSPGMRRLTEAFLAMGVVFASLAIPLALSGRWTGSAWAVEGAALVWVGCRQDRLRARLFGVFLQLCAGAALVIDLPLVRLEAVGGDGLWLVMALISLSGGFSGWYLNRHLPILRRWERYGPAPLLAWATLWWLAGGIREIDRQLPLTHRADAAALFFAASAGVMGWLAAPLKWAALAVPPVGLLPPLILLAVVKKADAGHLLSGWGAGVWPAAVAVQYALLHRLQPIWSDRISRVLHPATLWAATGMLALEVTWVADQLASGARTWPMASWGLMPAAVLLALAGIGDRLRWPVRQHPEAYFGTAGLGLSAYLIGWTIVSAGWAGDPAPLPYWPLLNPLDITGLIALAAIPFWLMGPARTAESGLSPESRSGVAAGVAGAALIALTTALARAVHVYGAVPYTAEALFDATSFQAGTSILWSLMALAAVAAANRRAWRTVWFAGGGLMALVVVKLFLVDLAGAGTVSRIISFLAVGGLMLVIGYVSPLPPRQGSSPPEETS